MNYTITIDKHAPHLRYIQFVNSSPTARIFTKMLETMRRLQAVDLPDVTQGTKKSDVVQYIVRPANG